MTRGRLVLVRHGESVWNLEERYQGQADSGLTERGQEQADQLAAWLDNSSFTLDRIVSSDLPRAWATAAAYQARTKAEIHIDPRLREIDVGAWTGQRFVDIARAFPTEVQAAAAGVDVRRGGGETFAELRSRVWSVLIDSIEAAAPHATAPSPTVCLFTHGGPIRVASAAAVGIRSPGHQAMAPPTNCSITVLDLADGAPAEQGPTGRIVQYNTPAVAANRPSRAE
jgi:glucosyl-3-phosphoglycerate phosphatase